MLSSLKMCLSPAEIAPSHCFPPCLLHQIGISSRLFLLFYSMQREAVCAFWCKGNCAFIYHTHTLSLAHWLGRSKIQRSIWRTWVWNRVIREEASRVLQRPSLKFTQRSIYFPCRKWAKTSKMSSFPHAYPKDSCWSGQFKEVAFRYLARLSCGTRQVRSDI